jgi:hypothetical protein
MKIWFCGVMSVLVLFSGICVAQVPAPPIRTPWASDASVSFIVAGRDPSSPYYGVGGQFIVSHYVNNRLGFQVEGDYLRTDSYNLRDIGVRVGPVVRFRPDHAVKPYVHALIGYAAIKSSYLNPATSFNGAPSILVGAGLDFPLAQHWRGRVGGDVEEDWAAIGTTVARAVVGISYRFGAR